MTHLRAHGCVATATASTATSAMASRVLSKSRCAHGQKGRKRTDEKADFGLHNTDSDAAFVCTGTASWPDRLDRRTAPTFKQNARPPAPADSKW